MAHLRPASAGQAISRGADWASAGEAATPRRSAREIPAKAAARMVPLRRCQPQDENGSGGPALPGVRNAGRWCPNLLPGARWRHTACQAWYHSASGWFAGMARTKASSSMQALWMRRTVG